MNQRIAIDAGQQPIGRFCSRLIAYLKENLTTFVNVFNIGELVMSNREATILRYRKIMDAGSITRGPFLHRAVDRLFYRTLRGMLSRSITHKNIFRRVRAFIAQPTSESIRLVDTILYRRVSIITLRELSTELRYSAPLTQQQSVGLLSQMSRVQIPGGAERR